MGKRIVGYLSVLLISIYLFFIYDEPVMSGILLLELLYPALSFLYLADTGKRIEIRVDDIPHLGEKNEKLCARISLKNNTRTRFVRYCVRVSIRVWFSRKCTRQRMRGVLEPGKTESLSFVFDSACCGKLEFLLDSLQIYDFLGIFYRKVRVKERRDIGIMPSFELMPLEITRKTREFPADGDDFSVEKSGDDPSEIYQVREYASRDSIHTIHWKLSAKEDKLMVKEYGLPAGCVVLLWLCLCPEGKESTGFAKMLEKAASLSVTLLEEKCIHMVAWFEEKSLKVIRWKVDSEQAVYEWIWRFFEALPCGDKQLEKAYYEEAFRWDYFSSIVVIDSVGILRVNGEITEVIRL